MAGRDMAVDGVVAEVEDAVFEPIGLDRIVGPARDLCWRRDPVETPCLLVPEGVGVVDALGIKAILIGGGAMCVCRGVGRDGNQRFGWG